MKYFPNLGHCRIYDGISNDQASKEQSFEIGSIIGFVVFDAASHRQ
jgi:hypothetical protein